ncbi:NAD-dependent epimerase/dehydratase family protein [Marinithermus hydrothermalis]|uniref:UDP-glucose 4-epimerase n=1 Tax=Marinithermus hydrothermalis (strain DSM 14884 / JCM 11576 / T1) TaxID=869210 RepID=F2NQX6_MARHT|nr:NAD-dependent epimerase/dehydratase family protein [Marinithermus hydrothermalis]AEB12554.1 UDP-glucose 4-epimerase [Marinithermus hydrothermalis DSM 14884]
MRVLVTGGAGFIGSHLVHALHQKGIPVAVLDDLSTGKRAHIPPDVPLYQTDIRDLNAVLHAFQDFQPTHVAHQAAQASVKHSVQNPCKDAEINLLGGLNILEAMRATGTQKIVFASTGGAIYGEVPEGRRAPETWPPKPKSPYAASKAAFEHYLEVYRQTHGLTYTTLRYANVYGPRQDPHGEAGVVAIFTNRLLHAQPVTLYARKEPGDPGCIRDYIHVEDVTRANLLALETNLEGTYNVSTGQGRTTEDVLYTIARALGTTPRVTYAPPRDGDLEVSVLDPTQLQAHGWRPQVPFEEGIRRTVAWFREQTQR